MIKGIFLDFYGTLVEEDDQIINLILSKFIDNDIEKKNSIIKKWSKLFSELVKESNKGNFHTLHNIEEKSLRMIFSDYEIQADLNAELKKIYNYWSNPKPDKNMYKFLSELDIPFYIVSNADDKDISDSIETLSIRPKDWITSEEAKS